LIRHYRCIACERFEGNLSQFLRGEKPFESAKFEEATLYQTSRLEDALSLADQAAKGLEFIHKKCVHKDIKAANFVVRRGVLEDEPKWVCKLTDLGFSRRIAEGGSGCDPTVRLGTRDWIAPELLIRIESMTQGGLSTEAAIMKLPFSKRSDVWAMGCVLHFIFTRGQHPYGETLDERLDNIPKCQPLISGRTVLARMSQTQFRPDLLIAEMIQRDPYRRPMMEAVVKRIEEWRISSDDERKPIIPADYSFQVARSINRTSLFYVVLLFLVQFVLLYIYVFK
jgi:serine/threonine protein kinase